MQKGRWTIALIAMLAILLVSVVGPANAKQKEVIIAEFNWPGSTIICQIMKHVLEDRLNVPVTVDPMVPEDVWQGIVWGMVDVFSELWWPNQYEEIQEFVYEQKTLELTLSYDNALQGFVIPTWVSKRYGITDIKDLNQHTKLFDLSRDGIGELWAGEPGWMATQINKIKISDYRLNYEPYVVDHWLFLNVLKEAIRTQNPIIFYYWTPDWIWAKYDLTWIKEPKYDPRKWKFAGRFRQRSSIACEYQPAKVYVGYRTWLKDRSPKAYQFFKNWYFALDEMSSLIAEIEEVPGNPRKDPVEVAKKWVTDHPDIVNDWIKGIE